MNDTYTVRAACPVDGDWVKADWAMAVGGRKCAYACTSCGVRTKYWRCEGKADAAALCLALNAIAWVTAVVVPGDVIPQEGDAWNI